VSAIKLRIANGGRKAQAPIPPSLLFFGLLICGACCWLGLQVASPLQEAAKLHGDNDDLERSVRQAQLKNQEARKQVEAIATDQGAILAARSKGYMFPNERPLHIQSDGSR
jgi:hypothetical protein